MAIGLGMSAAGATMLASYLFGVSAADPAAFGGGALVLCLVSRLANHLPGRLAVRLAAPSTAPQVAAGRSLRVY